jgi:hypothetical protein
VLISPRQLLDRLRHPRSRADDLAALRARFAAQPSRREAGDAALTSARRLRVLRREMSDALGEVDACHGCARGHPLPAGRWRGGHCCSGSTLTIWSQEECAALELAGTDPARLAPPRGDHAGCAFRGERGCSLEPEDRPTLCLRYACSTLIRELRARSDGAAIGRLAAELDREQRRFARELGP